jgi:Zn-dependent protease/CBS domain-containing protein
LERETVGVSGFFKRQILVARVYGIPVRIDYRWFIVFALSVWLIAANLEHGTRAIPAMHVTMAWFLAIITTLGLFLSVFGHELSHALMGRAEGIEIEEIVLHPFGGLARLRSEPDNPRAEFRIAVAGPAASFLFSLLGFIGMSIANMGGYRATAAVFFFLGFGNLLLAVFNLFPGYPLDGGRVLRALLWHRGGNIGEATRTAGRCGQVIAWALMSFGIFIAISRRDLFTGLWTVLVGLFLLDAASSVVKQAHDAKHATVAEAMTAPVAIEPGVLVSHFVDSILPLHRQTSFLVAERGRLHGILTLEDLKALPRERWREVRARDVMRPVGPLLFVEPSTTMAHANDLMQRNGTNALAVINSAGEVVGFLQRGRQARRKGEGGRMKV